MPNKWRGMRVGSDREMLAADDDDDGDDGGSYVDDHSVSGDDLFDRSDKSNLDDPDDDISAYDSAASDDHPDDK
eukprot:scaffold72898_cov32-Prasinocladus_malaysianus.AAC.1